WLGLFLMVPCACLLLRRRRMPWLVVAAVWVASVVFLFAALRWFAHQPYSLGESLVRGYFDRDFVYHFLSNALRAGLAVCFFLVPLTLAFVAELPLGNPRARRVVYFAAAGTALAAAFLLATHQFLSWQAPFVGTYVVNDGVEHPMTVGDRPVLLRPFTRVLLSLFTFAGTVATLAYCAARGKIRTQAQAPAHPAPSSTRPPWRMVLILLLPFTAVYTALLVHRALFDRVYDRYLLELLFVGAVLLARLYQDEVRSRLPAVTVAAVALSAIFSVAANHDLFSAERARLGAAQELIQAGVDRDRFLAGWEYDSWTQIDHYGFVNTGNIRLPTGYYVQRPIPYSISPRPCNDGWAPDFPAIHPQYVLSFDATSCDGPSGFAPVEYHAWLPPFRREMYIRRVVVPGQ
ncbi:MAG TPA: hypothetical protein VGU23_07730, partial [Acidobacteriaceae bacterium]|nr:hypothetical protein [Acidobacteriaceae bacterium]